MLFLALSGGYIAYYVSNNRGVLKDLLISQANELTVGKWSVDSLSINLWESYPYVVINLHNLKLYEDSTAMMKAKDNIFSVSNAKFRADIPSLMRKKLNVNHVGFSGFTVSLKNESDCDLNLIEALKLNNAAVIQNHILSFHVDKIDVSQMSITLITNKFSTKKPLLVDKLLAKVSRNGDIVNLSNCSLECYGLNFFLDLKYNIAKHNVAVDFSSSSRLFKFKGDVSFSKTSIATVKSNIESSIPLGEYSGGRMSGDLFAKGVVDFDFDMLNYRLIDDRCRLKFGINNLIYNHSINYVPQIVFQSGIIEYSSSSVVGSEIVMGLGTNKLELNFIAGSIKDIINRRENYDIGLSVNVKSSDFNPYIIKERLGLAADSLSDENSIRDLSIRFHTNISPSNSPLSFAAANGKFGATIDNYSARLNDSLKVSNFKGELYIEGNDMYLRDFKGLIKNSPTTLNSQISIKKREKSEVFEKVNIDVDLTTSHFSPHDIDIMPMQVVLNDLKSQFSVEIKPDANHQAEQLDNFSMKFNTFSATIDGKLFSLRSLIDKRGDKLKILNSIVEYDNDRFDLSGSIYLGGKNRRDTINVKSDNLDFKRFVNDKSTGLTELPEVKVPIVVNLNVGKFILLDQNLTDLQGVVCIETNRSLLFKDVGCRVAGGKIDFTGELTQKAKGLEIKSRVKYSDINFKDLSVKYKISKNDNDRYVNENLRGRISGTLDATLFTDKDMNIDVGRSVINANFTIVNGQLVNFAPIKAASKYFQRSDLNDIRFDTLSNQITIKSGVISVPRMNIASTLGNYFVSGTTSISDGKMNFMFEVPWNVIGGVVASRIFGGKPDSKKAIDGEIKKRYVKFYVMGTPEAYEVKLRNKGDEESDK